MTQTHSNIILNEEKLKIFSLKSGKGQRYPLSSLIDRVILGILAQLDKRKK